MHRSLLAGLILLALPQVALAQEPRRLKTDIELWVYTWNDDGRGVRRLGATTDEGGAPLPRGDEWFVRPVLDVTPDYMKRVADALRKHAIPGLSLRRPGLRPLQTSRAALEHLTGIDSLRFLEFMNCRGLAESWDVVGRLPSLQRLEIGGATIGAQALAEIGKLSELQHLDLQSSSCTDDGLAPLRNLKKLRWLNLRQARRLEGPGLVHIAGLPLETLLLGLNREIDDADLLPLTKLIKLKVLDLGTTQVGDDGLKTVASFERLEDLSLTGLNITGKGLGHLAKLERLRKLGLQGCRELDNDAAEAVSKLASLESLALTQSKLTDEGLKHLGELNTLRELSIAMSRGVQGPGLEHLAKLEQLESLSLASLDADWGHLTAFSAGSLQTLDLGGTTVSPATLEQVAKLSLKGLGLQACKGLTDEALQRLEPLKLERLDLTRSGDLTGAGLSALQPTLKVLRLSRGAKLDPESLAKALSRFAELRELDLSRLKTIDASVLRAVGTLKNLRDLDLGWCREGLDDEGLAHLGGLTKLRQINLSGCRALTQKGLEALVGIGLEEVQLTGIWQNVGKDTSLHVTNPARLEARKAFDASPAGREAAVIKSLRRLHGAQSLFRESDKEGDGALDYANDIAELEPIVGAELASGRLNGYRFTVRHSAESPEFRWMATASPLDGSGPHFAVDHRGDVYRSKRPFEILTDCQVVTEGATKVD